jgi:glycolate oxidase FAD binding subunit
MERLASCCPGHQAGPDDQVAGVPARWVARPGSIEQASTLMAACAALGLVVVPRGGGTKLDWAATPDSVDVLVDTTGLDRVEHAAGDLVLIAGAGVRLAALTTVLAEAGQELCLDQPIPGDAAGLSTLGGMASAAVTGPRRLLRGSPRDLVIGATLVRADGVVAKSGGRVVKNVAGYDLARLVCGAFGTLGLVAELTFRLHPVARGRRWVQIGADSPAEVFRLTRLVLDSPVVPSAVEVERPVEVERSAGSGYRLTVLLEGSADGVTGRAARLQALLGPASTIAPDAPDGWGVFPGEPDGVLVKLTSDLTGVPRLLAEMGDVSVRGSVGSGVLHAALPAASSCDQVGDLLARLRPVATRGGGSVVVLRAPTAIRDQVDLWGPIPALDLMRRVKDRFDPQRRLSPGRFVGGI